MGKQALDWSSILVWPFGIADLGLGFSGGRSPTWYRTDLAVYLLRYEHGWGKAEAEMEAQSGLVMVNGNIDVRTAIDRAA